MKINRTGYAQLVRKLENGKGAHKASRKYDEKDTIELSEASIKIKKYADTMKTMESENVEKIETIKAKLSSGTYKISSKELADRILIEIKEQISKEK
ncbi:MAG TPA: flagellar biosynthesis anti-sigma factor FlgM [Clostridia bacterium]|nr:flagellar biosynthesis anti-sigma factor FlgM [Clostridia bacterium]